MRLLCRIRSGEISMLRVIAASSGCVNSDADQPVVQEQREQREAELAARARARCPCAAP